jgi:SagB-type dehydrogenase family enzyme
VWYELGAILHDTGQVDEAEHHYRESARVSESLGDLAGAARSWTQLALVLQTAPGRAADARRFAEAALAVAQASDCTAVPVWGIYGLLSGVLEGQAADEREGHALRSQAHDYRQLARHGPAIRGSLDRLGPEASYGRAVILQRLGRCLRLGRRPDLALEHLRDALMITAQLTADAAARALEPGIRREMGDALRDLGQPAEADDQYAAAAGSEQPPTSRDVIVEDEVRVEHVFEPDLLLESPVERRIAPCTDAPPLGSGLRPVLLPGVRTCPDEDGAIRCSLPWGEPAFERRAECTIIRRTRRAVVISSGTSALWRVLRHLDGDHTVADLLAELPAGERVESAHRLAALAAAGVLDVSGRAMGRFIHAATKKGVLAAGGLVGDDVLRLVTDGSDDEGGDGARTALSRAVPDRLRAFHALTRARRSRRDYQGIPVRRNELDAVLHTACGITGALAWAGRELKLRAYPSSGALYAVAVYPVALRVQGLQTAVYRYCAREHALELVRQVTAAELLGAALPVERSMLGGAAALICLSGRFRRHERKYGEGGYRMLVAEAGHISQNLILAAAALGLSARPFGGVFDDLLNETLGLDRGEEQFLLSVVVGHAAGEHGAHS